MWIWWWRLLPYECQHRLLFWMQLSCKWCHHITWVSWKLWQQPWLDLADSSTNGTNNRNQFFILWCRVLLELQVSWNTLYIIIKCEKKNIPFVSAMISCPFMMVIQVHHICWESIAVIQFLPAMSHQTMRSWFIFILMVLEQKLDSNWNTIQ